MLTPARLEDGGRLRPAVRWFVGVALAWTWGFGFAAAALGAPAGSPLHLIALLGPLVAVVAALRFTTVGYRRRLVRRVLDVRRLPLGAWVGVVLVGLGPAVAATGVAAASGTTTVLEVSLTPWGVVGIVAFALAAGLAEEPGWRGVAVDGLAPGGLTRAAVGLGTLWSLWHLPLYFVDGTYQHGLGVGTPDFWVSMALRVPLAVLLVWLVRYSRGAVVAAVAAHALGNAAGEILGAATGATVAELAVTTAAAATVLVNWRLRPHGDAPAARVSTPSRPMTPRAGAAAPARPARRAGSPGSPAPGRER